MSKIRNKIYHLNNSNIFYSQIYSYYFIPASRIFHPVEQKGFINYYYISPYLPAIVNYYYTFCVYKFEYSTEITLHKTEIVCVRMNSLPL